MATASGRISTFELDNAAATLTDISVFVDDVSQSLDHSVAETTGLNTAGKTYVLGIQDGTIALTGPWSDTATTGSDAVIAPLAINHGMNASNASVSFRFRPRGSGGAGYTGETYVAEYSVNVAVDNRVSYSASLQITGGVTRS